MDDKTLQFIQSGLAKLLADNFPRASEQDEATRLIRYIASPSLPERDEAGSTAWYWKRADALLISPVWVPHVRQQCEAMGYTLVEVDEAWWWAQSQAVRRWGTRWLR